MVRVLYLLLTYYSNFHVSLSMLFSCATDKLGAVWDVEVGERIKKLRGHSSVVNSISASRRGPQVIATGSDDGTIRVSCSYSDSVHACMCILGMGSS